VDQTATETAVASEFRQSGILIRLLVGKDRKAIFKVCVARFALAVTLPVKAGFARCLATQQI